MRTQLQPGRQRDVPEGQVHRGRHSLRRQLRHAVRAEFLALRRRPGSSVCCVRHARGTVTPAQRFEMSRLLTVRCGGWPRTPLARSCAEVPNLQASTETQARRGRGAAASASSQVCSCRRQNTCSCNCFGRRAAAVRGTTLALRAHHRSIQRRVVGCRTRVRFSYAVPSRAFGVSSCCSQRPRTQTV